MAQTLLAPVAARGSKEIQVSGKRCFPGNHWREAILHYLFGVWGGENEVLYRPKISFGGTSRSWFELRLDRETLEYFAYWNGNEPPAVEQSPHFKPEEILTVGYSQFEVEQGLIRFVKNNRIRMLTISFSKLRSLHLWKGREKGQYGVTGNNIPHIGYWTKPRG